MPVAAAPHAVLSPETSLYLDAVRFFAAFIVFLGHFATQAISGGVFWQLAPFRHDAVIVFFVLSGFVIAHAVAKGENNAKDYFVNRAARIYSVALPALVITVVLDLIASRFVPDFCAWGCSPGSFWQQIITSATFSNQFWNLGMFPGTDGPYWSLGFEVPYYLIFGATCFSRGPWRLILPVALLGIAGPTIAALFPLWLLGAGIYRSARYRVPEWAGWMLFVGSLLIWGTIEFWALSNNGWILDFPIPGIWRDRIPADYVTGMAFAINIVGFRIIGGRFSIALRWMQSPIRWLAARTFTLYLLHFPVMRFFTAVLPWGVETMPTRTITFAGTVLTVLAVAACFELRKRQWRQSIERCLMLVQRVNPVG